MMGTEDELLIALDEGRGLLDQDNVPNENQSLECFSCGETMAGLFCHNCGNKNDNYRRSIFSLIIEMVENLTAIDSRMWRSLYSLIRRPGQMARDFSDGARQKWTSPVRLYIAASLLLFGYIALSQTQIIAVGSIGESQPSSLVKVGNAEQSLSPRLLFFVRKSEMVDLTDIEASTKYGSDFIRGIVDAGSDNMNVEELNEAILELDTRLENTEVQLEKDILTTTREGLIAQREKAIEAREGSVTSVSDEKRTVENVEDETSTEGNSGGLTFTGTSGEQITLDQNGLRQIIDMVMTRPELINNRVNDNLKLAMFFMMPLAMLLGAIFIRSRDRAMLYDHLVHAAYIHAFSFMLLLGFILLHQYTSLGGLLFFYTLILLIYLPISAKRMFGRGWFKSFLTAYGVGSVYSLVMLFVFAGIVVLALENLAYDVSSQQALIEGSSTSETSAP